jgi:hypothetical protein
MLMATVSVNHSFCARFRRISIAWEDTVLHGHSMSRPSINSFHAMSLSLISLVHSLLHARILADKKTSM